MSARAMHEFTDLLPRINGPELIVPPSALGVTTESAMASGLFWGAVGAMRQLIDELPKAVGDSVRTEVFLTGGAAANVAALLGSDTQYTPNLTLAGIMLAVLH
jgi:type III pantothenate kinase